MQSAKVTATRNYRLFTRSGDNRPLNPAKHKRLKKLMEQYGFLPCYPIVCVKNAEQHLVVLDGQHRLYFAELLGLPVYYAVLADSIDIAAVNCSQEKWVPKNFAETYAAQGKAAYEEGLCFSQKHGIPVGMSFALLGGTTSWTNISDSYYSGEFRIKDRQWAERVGTIYAYITNTAPRLKSVRLIEACMAIARVSDFDVQRLFSGIDRCREKLLPYSTRDAYLDMLECVYNYGRSKLVGLKVAALQALRDRNFATKKKNKTAQ